MVDNVRDRSKAEHSHKAHPTRAGSMGKTHLAKIVQAVRRIAAKPLILRALTDKPVLPVHEYLDRTEAQDDRHGSLSRRLKEHDAGVTTSPSASRGNAKFTRSDHFLAVRNHDVATRSHLWDRTAPLGPTISIRERDLACESARALKRQELDGQRDHRTAQHQWVKFGDSSSSGKESEALIRRPSQPNNSGEKRIPLVASRESGTSLMGLESGGLGKIIKRLTYVCERLSEVKQAARQLDAIKTGTLSGGSNGMAIAPTKRLLARSNLGAERAKRHGGARDKSESPRSTFVDKQLVGRHSEAVHFGPTEASRVLSSISAKGSTAAGLSAHLRAGRPEAQQSASVQPTVAGSRATRFSGNSNQKGDPFIINFSPTVVIQSHAEIIDFENRFVEAMTRHSYELVRLINRELQIQGRAAF